MWSRANVLCVLTYSRANVPCVLTCSDSNVSCMFTWSCVNVSCVLTCSRVNVPYVSCMLTWERTLCAQVQKVFFCSILNWGEKSLWNQVKTRGVTRNVLGAPDLSSTFWHKWFSKFMISQINLGFPISLKVHSQIWDNFGNLEYFKNDEKCFFISPYKLFSFSGYLNFCIEFVAGLDRIS